MSTHEDDKQELVNYKGKKGSGVKKCLPLEPDDLNAILDMTITQTKKRGGCPAAYSNDQEGFERFICETIGFFEYVRNVNNNNEKKLIPDIESWGVYLGVTRQVIFHYQERGPKWDAMIKYYKNCIAAIKKQLALNYKIPPMVYVFDAVNNHGYVNSNEFHLIPEKPIDKQQLIEHEIDAIGLEWDEKTGEYKPKKGG